MATQEQTVTLSGLARTLVRGGYIDQQSAERVLTESRKKKTNFLNQVVTDKLVSSTAIASAAAQEFGMCMVAIDLIEIEPEIVKLVNAELIKKHNALPIFRRGKKLTVAVADPTNIQALDEIKFATGLNAHAVVVEVDKLTKRIEKILDDADGGLGDMELSLIHI